MSNDITTTDSKPLAQQLTDMHPIHSTFIRVFEQLGGEERLAEWANENFGDFVKIIARIAPRSLYSASQSEMRITIHPALSERSTLDG